MTLAEFLDWERGQPTRHELIDGEIVAMTGARAGHVGMVARLMERLSRKPGWFVPVSTLLDYLREHNGEQQISPGQRFRLEAYWLLQKLLHGTS